MLTREFKIIILLATYPPNLYTAEQAADDLPDHAIDDPESYPADLLPITKAETFEIINKYPVELDFIRTHLSQEA